MKKTLKGKILSWGTLGHFLEAPLQRYSVPSEALRWDWRESGRGNNPSKGKS